MSIRIGDFIWISYLTNMILSDGSHDLNQVPNSVGGSGDDCLGVDDDDGGFTRRYGGYVVRGRDMVG